MKYILLSLVLISSGVSAGLPAAEVKWKLEKSQIRVESSKKEYILRTDCNLSREKSLRVETRYRTLREGVPLRVNGQKCLIEEIERIA